MCNMQELRENFQEIEHKVNTAISKLDRDGGSWSNEPINWADLRCACVEYIIGNGYEYYQATIEEADPTCPHLVTAIDQMVSFDGELAIVTEW